MAFDIKAATPDTSAPTTGFLFGADSQAATDPSIYPISAVLTPLVRVDANTIAQKNAANAQVFQVYNSDDGAGNSQYGQMRWTSGGALQIGGIAATGTGDGNAQVYIGGDASGNVNGNQVIKIRTNKVAFPGGDPAQIYSDTNTISFSSNQYVPNNNIQCLTVLTTPKTVATLQSAATVGAGARAFVTDATAPTFGATVAGGGAVATPVYSDGTDWKVG